MLLDVANESTKGPAYESALEHICGDYSICGEYIDEQLLESVVKNRTLADELILNVITPLIVASYNERMTKGPSSNGINDFFKQLSYEDNKYDLDNLFTEFRIRIPTVSNYENDLYSKRGQPTKANGYMWRKRPK